MFGKRDGEPRNIFGQKMNAAPREAYNNIGGRPDAGTENISDIQIKDSHIEHAGSVAAAIKGFAMSIEEKARTNFRYKGETWTFNPQTEEAERVDPATK